jgi:hypothetical protein
MRKSKPILFGLLLTVGSASTLAVASTATPATLTPPPASGQSPATGSLHGIEGMDLAFDFQVADPKAAALFLRLIHETYLDRELDVMDRDPRFVVVIGGRAVQLITGEDPGFSEEDQAYLREITERIAEMSADGIRIEGCLKAAQVLGVDSERFADEVVKINNAWISLGGYHAGEYAALSIR